MIIKRIEFTCDGDCRPGGKDAKEKRRIDDKLQTISHLNGNIEMHSSNPERENPVTGSTSKYFGLLLDFVSERPGNFSFFESPKLELSNVKVIHLKQSNPLGS